MTINILIIYNLNLFYMLKNIYIRYNIYNTMFNECQNTIHTSILGCELPFGLCQHHSFTILRQSQKLEGLLLTFIG